MPEEVFQSPKRRGKIAVFLSGRGSNFKAIHAAVKEGKINADIALVFSNKEQAPGLVFAREQNLGTLYLNPNFFAE